MPDLVPTVDEVLAASTYEVIFVDLSSLKNIRKTYLKWVKAVHPDYVDDSRAGEAFHKLQGFNEQAMDAVNGVNTSKPKASTGVGMVFHDTKRDIAYAFNSSPRSYGSVMRYVGESSKAKRVEALVNRFPGDRDLLIAGCEALEEIHSFASPHGWSGFFPEFLLQDTVTSEKGYRYGVQVTKAPSGGFISLSEVKKRYPHGLHGRDVAWIYKRLLVATGVTWDAGWVHGSPNADAVLIEPDEHGLILTQWFGAVRAGEPLKLKGNGLTYLDWMSDKSPSLRSFDVALVSQVALGLLRKDDREDTKALRRFLQGASLRKVPRHTELLREFDELLVRIYGPPKFHKFGSD